MLDFEAAKKKAALLLARRRLTQKELTDRLMRTGCDEGIAEDVLIWANEYGLVNDREYARAYIADAVNIKKLGQRRMRHELLFKGIDASVLDDVLEEFELCESQALLPLMEKKLGGKFDRANTEKAARYFAARGYAFSDIREALRRITHNRDDL